MLGELQLQLHALHKLCEGCLSHHLTQGEGRGGLSPPVRVEDLTPRSECPILPLVLPEAHLVGQLKSTCISCFLRYDTSIGNLYIGKLKYCNE